jgi:hypothetical protein
MRYWGYLTGKLILWGGAMYSLLRGISWYFPSMPGATGLDHLGRMAQDLQCNLAIALWFLICCGSLYAVILDQRYRCRVCLRRLRMPIETGSRASMLQFGQPRIEYICPYGHGTLKEAELQISGRENPEWIQHAEYWEELCAQAKDEEADR